jgi:rhodanese-related sulfurtransferase
VIQTIGAFQFDNLVKGRVPFLFVNLGVDTSSIFPHVYKMHLERMQMQVAHGELKSLSPEDIVAHILSQGKPLSEAIIVLCEDGSQSAAIGAALEAAHFINVFVIEGGWKAVQPALSKA